MNDNRMEQIEALETLASYNPKVSKALNEIIPELKGEAAEDTQEYLDHIFKGVTWELQVINATMDLINENEKHFSKESLNQSIEKINNFYNKRDNAALASVVEEELLPFINALDGYIENVLAE